MLKYFSNKEVKSGFVITFIIAFVSGIIFLLAGMSQIYSVSLTFAVGIVSLFGISLWKESHPKEGQTGEPGGAVIGTVLATILVWLVSLIF